MTKNLHGRKTRVYSEAVKEKVRAEYRLNGGNLTAAIRAVDRSIPYNTAKRWVRAPDSPDAAKVREEEQATFIREAYASAMKGIRVGNSVLEMLLDRSDVLKEALLQIAKGDLDPLTKSSVLQAVAALGKVNLKDLAYYIGIVRDKGTAAEGSSGLPGGQVIASREYRVLETVVASHPELLQTIFPPNRNDRPRVEVGGGPGTRSGMGELR